MRKIKNILLASAIAGFAYLNVIPANAEETSIPMITIQKNDVKSLTGAVSSLLVQESEASTSTSLDLQKSDVSLAGLKVGESGLQLVKAQVKAVEVGNTTIATTSKDVLVKVEETAKPKLELKADTVTVNNGDTFLPESYISYIDDGDGNLPAITVNGTVDTSVDGTYTIAYKVINRKGDSTDATLTVIVETSEDQRIQQQLEADYSYAIQLVNSGDYASAIAIFETLGDYADSVTRKADAEAKLSAQQLVQSGEFSTVYGKTYGMSGVNPYSGGWSNCTAGAWEAAYENLGISLPSWGNAGSWYYNAASQGWSVGSSPAVGSIGVYSHHVVYVDAVSGDSIHIIEGNYAGHYNERWVSAYGLDGQALIGYIYLQ